MKAYQNLNITGSINVTGSGITGSLHGTASYAETASYVNILTQDVTMSGSISISGSLLINGLEPGFGNGSSVVISGSAPSGSQSGSMWFNDEDLNLYIQYFDGTSSYWVPSYNNQSLYANSSSFAATASLAHTASFARSASLSQTASLAVTASHALTASSANNFRISGSLTALSGSTFAGTASFTHIGSIMQEVLVIGNRIQHGLSQRPAANYSVAIGNNTIVSGGYAVGVGSYNFISASANVSFVAGQYNTASAFGQTVVGQYNATNNTPAAFIIGGGSGTESGSRKNTAVFTTSSIAFSASISVSGSLLVNGRDIAAAGAATVTITGSAPSGSKDSGSLWWNENDGNLYIQVTTPTGSTYVPATNTVAGGNYGATLTSANSGSVWNITHNFNTRTPIITVYSGSSVMIPASIDSLDANNTRITFSGSVTGTAVISTGVGGATTASFAINTLSASFAATATSASFATSASRAVSSSYAVSSSFASTVGTLITESVTITGTTTNPTKGSSRTMDKIVLADYGNGMCYIFLNYYQVNGGSGGTGDYLFTLPAGYRFDTSVHSGYTGAGDQLMSGIESWIPGSSGFIAATGNVRMNAYAAVYDETRFRILMGGEGIYSLLTTVRTPIGSALFSLVSAATAFQMAFAFKKL